MGLFDLMSQTQDLLSEALTDQERKDRAIRKNIGMIVQQAVTTAQRRTASSSEGVDLGSLERVASEHGDVVFRASFISGDDADKTRVVREVQRVLKQAGVEAQAGLTTRGNLKVVVDRGYFAQMGGTNPMNDLASRVLADEPLDEMHDVTRNKTSRGSTKGMLPAHKAKMKKDQEDAVVRRAADQAADEAAAEEEEEVFESRDRLWMVIEHTSTNVYTFVSADGSLTPQQKETIRITSGYLSWADYESDGFDIEPTSEVGRDVHVYRDGSVRWNGKRYSAKEWRADILRDIKKAQADGGVLGEALQPYNMKRDQARFELDKLRIEGPARRVPRAKMLWKKKEDDGTFTERWMYLAQSIDDLVSIKRKILAGTDIPVNKTMSPDGKQGFVLEQFGDIVWITINGVSK